MAADKKSMRDKDVLFSVVLILSAVSLIVYSLDISIKAMAVMKASFYTAPGFTSLVVASALLLLGAVLLAIALRESGDLRWLAPASLFRLATSSSAGKTVLVFLYLFLYMVVFWERVPFTRIRVPFWCGTFFFLAAMLITFKAVRFRNAVLLSAAAAGIIDFVFRVLAAIPLP